MAATAKIGNANVVRRADKTTVRAHRHCKIGWVTTVTIMAGDAVLGMDTLSPLLNRGSQGSFLSGMALDTNSLFLCQSIVGSSHRQQAGNYNGSEQSNHE